MDFVSLHTHTTYSYADGFAMPADHANRVADLGMTALAATEHGNLHSVVKHFKACQAAGIKPIYGLEAYTAPSRMREMKMTRKGHQTILAADQQGYQNLMAMVTKSWSQDFYRWPTVTPQSLWEHAEGLIVTSGCADSMLSMTLLGGKWIEQGDERAAERLLLAYRRHFGDRFYLEVQQFPALERTRQLNPKFAEWSAKHGVPLVATADVHYPFPGDSEMQKVLHAAGRNTGTVAAAEAEWEYSIKLTYPTSDGELLGNLVRTGLTPAQAGQALENSKIIGQRCSVELPVMDRVVYPFEEEGAHTEEELIRRWLSEGWLYRGFNRLPREEQRRARTQVEEELRVYRDKGFLSYFLMIADMVRWAKMQGIAVGPGRGSGAASLTLFLLRVSEVNPMHYPLMLHERFVAPDRDDLPDVDIDFEPDRRDEVRVYAARKYGEDRVGNVGTVTMYRGKNSIDDVGRVHQVPFVVTKKIKDMLVDDDIEVTRRVFPVVDDLFTQHPELEFAQRLQGNVKGFGIHAAGIVVGADRLDRYVGSTEKTDVGKEKKTVQALSVDKYDGELLGLLKIDALGLKTMGIIKDAAAAVGMTMEDVYAIDLSDPLTMEGFRSGQMGGIFQFEGATTRDICVEVQPTEFMDLSHINALARPGPLHGGSTADFIAARRWGRKSFWPEAAEYWLAPTEGEIVYQEQVIGLSGAVGGFDAVGRSKIRAAISKKKGQEAFAEYFAQFEAGGLEKGFTKEQVAELWRKMITAGGYAFNVAHSVSYSVLAVWTMWLRMHHPKELFWSRLKYSKGDVDAKTKIPKRITILKDMVATTDIPLLPLDLHRSGFSWTAEDDGIRPGFAQLPGIGDVVGEAIVAWRDAEATPTSDWHDMIAAKGVGPKTIEAMVAFAEAEDPFEIGKISRNTRAISAWCAKRYLPVPDKTSAEIPYTTPEGGWTGTMLGVVQEITLRDHFESYRNRTGKELDPKEVNQPELRTSAVLWLEDVRGRFKVNIGRFHYPDFASEISSLKINQDYALVEVTKGNFPGKTLFVNSLVAITPDER